MCLIVRSCHRDRTLSNDIFERDSHSYRRSCGLHRLIIQVAVARSMRNIQLWHVLCRERRCPELYHLDDLRPDTARGKSVPILFHDCYEYTLVNLSLRRRDTHKAEWNSYTSEKTTYIGFSNAILSAIARRDSKDYSFGKARAEVLQLLDRCKQCQTGESSASRVS
jgi:hypothetical protein